MNTIFYHPCLSLLFLEPGSEIRDPGWLKIRIRYKHPGSATLLCTLSLRTRICTYDLYGPVRYLMLSMRANSLRWGSGRGLDPGNLDFFGPCKMSSSRVPDPCHWIRYRYLRIQIRIVGYGTILVVCPSVAFKMTKNIFFLQIFDYYLTHVMIRICKIASSVLFRVSWSRSAFSVPVSRVMIRICNAAFSVFVSRVMILICILCFCFACLDPDLHSLFLFRVSWSWSAFSVSVSRVMILICILCFCFECHDPDVYQVPAVWGSASLHLQQHWDAPYAGSCRHHH